MLITFVFFLAFLASLSSEAAFPDQGIESSLSRIRRQSEPKHSYRAGFFQDGFRFGLESFCDTPYNGSEVGGHQYNIDDCVELIDFLAGEDNYQGYWAVQDGNCSSDAGHWWITVAGWGTCNFAVSLPGDYCNNSIESDIAGAISWTTTRFLGETQGNLTTAWMNCPLTPDMNNNVSFMVFDPSNFAHDGNVNTTLNGYINGTTTLTSFPTVSTTTSTTPTTSSTCSSILECLPLP